MSEPLKQAENQSPRRTKLIRAPTRPKLRFSPYAWAKLLYLRDCGDTEVGGFGISATEDLLLVDDLVLVRQRCTSVTLRFDDEAVADYFDAQVDRGLPPERFARIWLHTHPGISAEPTVTDEETLSRCFGSCEWAVMLILAKGGQTMARLQFNIGPRYSMELPVEVDYRGPFPASEHEAWSEEFKRCVVEEPLFHQAASTGKKHHRRRHGAHGDGEAPWWWDDPFREELGRGPEEPQTETWEESYAADDQPF
jgi:hypothetical protein